MDTQLITIYVLCDDLLRTMHHREDGQCTTSDAEVMTAAIAAARFFRGNFAAARLYLDEHGYVRRTLSPGQFSRRLARLTGPLTALFDVLASLHRGAESDGDATFIVDSFPVACCDNIRIRRSKLYPLEATGGAFRGFIASKRRFFYGLRVHWVVTSGGLPVEFHLAPGSYNDTKELSKMALALPASSSLYGDKAYNDYEVEDLLRETEGVALLPVRRGNSKRPLDASVEYLQRAHRKAVETAASMVERLLPKSIHATSARGFELKVFLFLLAHSLSPLM
jgi:hypothetical protein